jgi:hypothetical protein
MPIAADHWLGPTVMVAKKLVGTIEKVETHQPDPTSRGEPDPWDTVQDQMGELGDRLKEAYRRVADDGGPGEEELRQAFATLAGVWDQLSSSLSVVFHDPELRLHLKATAATLAETLGDTITGVGREMRHDAEEE